MAIDIITWILIASVGILVIFIGALFMLYLNPMRNSPARFFVKAKRKNKPLAMLDNGSHWVFAVGETEVDGMIVDDSNVPIQVAPNSIKYGAGVRIGVGENYRGIVVDPRILKLISIANKEKIPAPVLRKAIETLEEEELQDVQKKKEGNTTMVTTDTITNATKSADTDPSETNTEL